MSPAAPAPGAIRLEDRTGEDEWETPIPFEEHCLPTFPIDALPAACSDFVLALSTFTQTPVDLAAILLLGVLATAAAGRVDVEVKRGWAEPLNLYLAVFMPSGSRKSPVFKAMAHPVERFQEDRHRERQPAVAEAQSAIRILRQKLEKLEKDAARTGGQSDLKARAADDARRMAAELKKAEQDAPHPYQLLADDTTPERIIGIMRSNGGRIAILSAEAGIFDLAAGRYSGKESGGLPDVFLKGYTGEGIRVDRMGREAEFVSRPLLTVAVCAQPDSLAALMSRPGFRDRGLHARFCCVLPETRVGYRVIDPEPVPDEETARYHRVVSSLLSMPAATGAAGEETPGILTLSPGASELLRVFRERVERELRQDGALSGLVDWGSKLPGNVVRIAGLLSLAEHCEEPAPWSQPISAEIIRAAIKIGDYLTPHAAAVYSRMGGDEKLERASRLLGWIRRTGRPRFTKRDAFVDLRSVFQRADDLDPALAILCERSFIRPVETPTHAGRGRPPSPEYLVSPMVAHKSQNAQNCGAE